MAQNAELHTGLVVGFKGEKAKIVSLSRGWIEIEKANGTRHKVRKSDIELIETQHVVIRADLGRYTVGLHVTETGRKTVDIADEAADKLRGMPLDAQYGVVAKALFDAQLTSDDVEGCEEELRKRYAKLNNGMQRMNLGNRLRKAIITIEINNKPPLEMKSDIPGDSGLAGELEKIAKESKGG